MARKETPETDKTEAQDKTAEDAPAPETEQADAETHVSDPPGETPDAETPEQPVDDEPTAQDASTQTPEAADETREPEAASEPEPAEIAAEVEALPDSPTSDDETGAERTARPENDDPTVEVATLAEAEEAQATGQFAERSGETATPAPAPVTTTEQVTIRQGGFWSMLLGGVVAAGIGVVAAPYVLPEYLLNPPQDSFDPAELQDRIAAQQTALDDLQSTVEAIPNAPDLSGEVSGLRETLAGLTDRISALESRIAGLENRPAPETGGSEVSASQISELRTALDAQRKTLDAQRAEIDALKGEAAAEEAAARDSARATLQRAALTRVMTALDTGEDFTVALTALRDTGAEVPAALSDVAESGVPTQSALTESFPEAARAALSAIRNADGGTVSSFGSFFKSQLGLRSLEPREGDDPDAVLSRVEAAVRDGRLGDALAEVDTLPEGARAALSDWAAEAERRTAALSAANALADMMN